MISQESEVRQENKTLTVVNPNRGFMQVNSISEAMTCAEVIAKSSFCPKQMAGNAGDIVVALQMGQELGLQPMQALQNIAVINGRPSLWGDGMLAVCRQSKSFEYIREEYFEKDKSYICRVKRKDEPEFMQRFSMEDAKIAGLWDKVGPWKLYPRRMLQMRARGFALRDAFPDLLRGIISAEEAFDIPSNNKSRIDYSNGTGEIIEGMTVEFSDDELISEMEMEILKGKIKHADSTPDKICSHLEIKELNLMKLKDFPEVIRMLEKKIKVKEKNEANPLNKMLEGANVEVIDNK